MSVTNTAITAQVAGTIPDGPCGDDDCGIRDVLDRLGDRWTVLVIVELSKGVRRFRELERAIPGISQRMLTLTTKRLCRDGMVERIAYPTIPPQVEYRLTDTGQSLAEAIGALADWSRDHKDRIADARRRWDTEHTD
ncbi:winged helix-turn-helix transcriptional regulator [Nocardia vinacea]|uniref:winged helix-turn-helix transcriptional regulator n=1 Tax=Nocardia vinacea TaxID=96468 RepID=UPI0002DA2977|nr:helix-turn-helix domain-containing protein [Nocardia vinacea]